jgi:Leucine-rich repeat (LRR) protein
VILNSEISSINFTMHLLVYLLLSFFLMQNNVSTACMQTERTALLSFKSKLKDPSNRLSTWKGKNCCSWKGVTCHHHSGNVVKLNLRYPDWRTDLSLNGEIDPSLLSLRNLTHLDLSQNNFNETEIPNFIGQFENLVYLNLSFTKFVGKIPTEIGNLKNLRYLDMSCLMSLMTNFHSIRTIPPELGNISTLLFLSFGQGCSEIEIIENIQWISKLNSLQHLDLSYVDLSSSTDWFYTLNELKSLKVLILSGCYLNNIPADVATLNLTSLTTLDLSSNSFESPVPSWLSNLTSVSYLDLSMNDGYGETGDGFNGFSKGFWSNSEEKMCHLRHLDLSLVNITGDITDFVRKISCSWKIIEVLSLANNNLHGNLQADWLTEMSRLTHLDVRQNSIAGVLPHEIVNLSKLNYLDLSSTNLKGIVSHNLLDSLTQLQVLDLSFSMLKIELNHHWVPKFQLTALALQSCNIGPMFPSWLKYQRQISYLNLQNSNINDDLPSWFWRPSYVLIDLSYNNLHGQLPQDQQSPNLEVLILSSTNLRGPIKSLPHNLFVLDISSNKFSGTLAAVSNLSQLGSMSVRDNLFSGEIPPSICEIVYLVTLDLSMNKFSGTIPNCVSKLNYLEILDISFNNLSGAIPNSIGSMISLYSLVLHGNILTEELPVDLKNCEQLEFLDLGDNKLIGKVPTWIGVSLRRLAYLQLRENNFSGNIPSELAQLPNLQVLDIASNNLEGSIPDSFGSFSAMVSNSKHGYSVQTGFGLSYDNTHVLSYSYKARLAVFTKGEIIEYSTNLYLVKVIDLSDNNLSGFIPNSIVALEGLQNLNLSRNNMNGKISEKIGNMKSLESLDLSFNKLSGEIPQSMSELTFLSHLNLSYNNLSGSIPVGNQLNSLNDSSIYVGNIFLCGGPMNKTCSINEANNNMSDVKTNNSHTFWLYLSVGAGFVVGWWGVWCIFLLHGTWSAAFFKMVDNLFYRSLSSL